MCECLSYDDGTQHTCEACVPLNEYARKRLAALEPAAREALAVLTRLADSAYRWAGRDVPVGLISEVDAAKARLAGVLNV
jgi:hypothetical protein